MSGATIPLATLIGAANLFADNSNGRDRNDLSSNTALTNSNAQNDLVSDWRDSYRSTETE